MSRYLFCHVAGLAVGSETFTGGPPYKLAQRLAAHIVEIDLTMGSSAPWDITIFDETDAIIDEFRLDITSQEAARDAYRTVLERKVKELVGADKPCHTPGKKMKITEKQKEWIIAVEKVKELQEELNQAEIEEKQLRQEAWNDDD